MLLVLQSLLQRAFIFFDRRSGLSARLYENNIDVEGKAQQSTGNVIFVRAKKYTKLLNV